MVMIASDMKIIVAPIRTRVRQEMINLVAVIDGLHVYELPWMQEQLADEQYNLPWERRFEHPIYIAWRLRREAR